MSNTEKQKWLQEGCKFDNNDNNYNNNNKRL